MDPEVQQTQTPPALTPEDIQKMEQARVTEIRETGDRLAARFPGGKEKMDALVRDAIELKLPIDKFRWDVYARINDSRPLDTPATELGMSDREKKRYSISRAILSMIPNSGVKADIEREASDAIVQKLGTPAKGIFVPHDIQMHKRDLSVGTTTAGGYLVGTDNLGASFIELLRNRLVLSQVGMQVLTGLVGSITIPKQSGAATAYWVNEGSAPTESQQTFAQVSMSPKTVGAFTDFTRKLLLQSNPAVDMLVQNDLTRVLGLAIDYAGLHGSGSNYEPTGVAATSNIGSVSGGTLGWTGAVEFETDVATANADIATMAFIMNAAARGTLKSREKNTNYPLYLIGEDNRLNGYPVFVTNQAASGYIFFGVWNQLLMGLWGVLDLTIDPYTASTTGTIRVVALQSVDFGVRQPGAFSVASDFS